ncbi:MAG: hypothetical protein FWE83_05960 [Oscillospiraceae bacterium]|nr:hypothetical protein [Oscillospiraceae bacterium]
MVIQGFNVNVSSQHTFMSAQTASVAVTSNQRQDQNDQGQNNNNQGQNVSNQGQNVNNQGQNNNNQGQNVNNQGQNNNNQGQNVNNQGQSKEDIFKALFKNAREEREDSVNQLSKGTPASRLSHGRNSKIPGTPQELRARMSQMIYELLSGRFSRLRRTHEFNEDGISNGRGFDLSGFFGGATGLGALQRIQGVGGLSAEFFHYESETVTYTANGTVHTADGRTISVDISMHMSREFVSFMGFPGGNTTLLDPLVINYGGTAASLMGERFSFDLTMDGTMDNLAVLGEGSGFLAIDRNGDRKINDGSQLFGPSTGCGFNELRKYDTDGNGWIDANDEIFDKLVVWKRDKDGNDTVYTLAELGIGAIFLGDISTEFSFKGENNETLGVMRSTSFFIKQCGGSGTLSHIDLALA